MKDNSKLYASLKELAALGSPVDLSVPEVEPGSQAAIPTLEIDPIGRESHVFQLKDGRTGYMIYVRITNQTGQGIYPVETELHTPWGECITDWLAPSKVSLLRRAEPDSYYLAYRFPQARELAYDEVLNHHILNRSHHILNRRKLMPRQPFEGYLVAEGEPMPADIKHGQRHELDLTITGSDHPEIHPNHLLLGGPRCARAAARGGETRRSGWTGWRRRDPGVGAHAVVSDSTRVGRNRIFSGFAIQMMVNTVG